MDSKRRSLIKAVSWRFIAVVITGTVAYALTDSAAFAVSIGVVDSVIKIFAYYLHERAWASVPRRAETPTARQHA